MTDQTAPVLSEEEREALIRVLRSAPDNGSWRAGMDADDYADLAEAVLASDWLARHRQQAVREALAEVEALADRWVRRIPHQSGAFYPEATAHDNALDYAYEDCAEDLRAAITRAKGGDA